MATKQKSGASGATTTDSNELSLLDRIVQEGNMAVEPSQDQ